MTIDLAHTLFPEAALTKTMRDVGTGVLPFQFLKAMLREGEVFGSPDIVADQVQPASLDLRLGRYAYRVRASFLAGPNATVMERIEQLDGYAVDLSDGAVLERGCVYVAPLAESVSLRSGVTGFANPKSSTGRLDILTRLITDYGTAFDSVSSNYSGPLYAEIAPRTFSIVARTGDRLNQLRFRRGSPPSIHASGLKTRHEKDQLVLGDGEPLITRDNLLGLTIDLQGTGRESLIGYRAKKHTDRIDLRNIGGYDSLDFWEPLYFHRDPSLILDPNEFYILATRESVRIPPELAAEMVAYDTAVGEFRVHYAGFFDPGFGWNGDGKGAKAVLEVRSHEVPFMLEHGQTVGWLRYEKMADKPDRLYGQGMGSNYQGQGLKLAKQFRDPSIS